MDLYKVLIVLAVGSCCLCAENATTTMAPDLSANTTAAVSATNTTTVMVPANTTTTTVMTPTNTTMATDASMNTTTTTMKPTEPKKLGCSSDKCPPYSLCGDANVCLMKCPNATAPAQAGNSSAQVCGSDDVTYASLEELKMKSCESKIRVAEAYKGECKPEEKKEKKSTKYVIIVIVLILVLIVVAGVAAYWIYNKKKTQSKDLSNSEKSGDNLL